MAVSCSDGSEYHADILIAADGIASTARSLLDPADSRQYDHFIAYRAAVPFHQVADSVDLDNLTMWTGPNRHFIQYPLRRGEIYNLVAVFRSPSLSASVQDWGSPEELDVAFADVCSQLQVGLKLINRGRHWVMSDRPPLDRWTVNCMTLLGDAAHPMYQYAAQDACQAIEDAWVLAEYMTQHEDIRSAFAAYESERTLRTARIQRTARWFGDAIHLGGPGALIRNQILSRRDPADYAQSWQRR
jgi:2-polyprenyl-6-methoxyphenol hydroxylase-like FAD-dependent oxidoreductase